MRILRAFCHDILHILARVVDSMACGQNDRPRCKLLIESDCPEVVVSDLSRLPDTAFTVLSAMIQLRLALKVPEDHFILPLQKEIYQAIHEVFTNHKVITRELILQAMRRPLDDED